MNGTSDPSPGSAVDWRAIGLLSTVSGIWGASYPLIKIAVAEVPPVTLATARITIAALLLCTVTMVKGTDALVPSVGWRSIARIAFWGYACPYCLLAWSEQYISSGEAAILLASIPLLTVIQRSSIVKRVGAMAVLQVLPGLCGVVLLIGPSAFRHDGESIAGHVAALLASASFARALNLTADLPRLPAIPLAASLLTLAAAMLLPVSLIIERPWLLSPTTKAILALLWLSLLGTAVALAVYLRLIAIAGAAFASLNNYLAPVSALVLSVLLLAEHISPMNIVSIVLIFASITLMAQKRDSCAVVGIKRQR